MTHLFIMHLFTDFARFPDQASDRIFADLHQLRGGLNATACIQMIDHRSRLLFGDLGIEKRTATAFAKLSSAVATAQVAYLIMAVYLAYHQIAQARLLKILACFVHTTQIMDVRSRFHHGLLACRQAGFQGVLIS